MQYPYQNGKFQQVDTFKYLGALITDDAECTRDIRATLGNGTGNLKSVQRLWQSHDVSVDKKVWFLKPLYGFNVHHSHPWV